MAALTPTAKASLFSVVVPADLSAGEYYFTIKAEGHHDKPRKDPQYPVQVLFFAWLFGQVWISYLSKRQRIEETQTQPPFGPT